MHPRSHTALLFLGCLLTAGCGGSEKKQAKQDCAAVDAVFFPKGEDSLDVALAKMHEAKTSQEAGKELKRAATVSRANNTRLKAAKLVQKDMKQAVETYVGLLAELEPLLVEQEKLLNEDGAGKPVGQKLEENSAKLRTLEAKLQAVDRFVKPLCLSAI
jgi:hypothetical protein